MNKYLLCFGLLTLVSGCFQSTASLLGPAYTLANTGNVYQAGFSYGVNQALQKATGKNSREHVEEILVKSEKLPKKIEIYKEKTEQKFKDITVKHEEFLSAVKADIAKSKGKLLN